MAEPDLEPLTPSGLVAESGDEEVALSWDPLLGPTFERFRVYSCTSADHLAYAGATLPGDPTFTIGGLSNGVTYYFAVSAVGFTQIEGPRSEPVSARPEPRFRIEGIDVGLIDQTVRITRRSVPVDGASVTANGVTLEETEDGTYAGALPFPLQPGEAFSLSVQVGESRIVGTALAAAPPAVTSPAHGNAFTGGQTFTVEWEAASDPDRFEVLVCWEACAMARRHQVFSGTLRSIEVSTLGLPVDLVQSYTVEVYGYMDGAFDGPAEAGSRLGLRTRTAPGSIPTITITP